MILRKVIRQDGEYNGIHYTNYLLFVSDSPRSALSSVKVKAKTPLFICNESGEITSESTVAESGISEGLNVSFSTNLFDSTEVSAVFVTV